MLYILEINNQILGSLPTTFWQLYAYLYDLMPLAAMMLLGSGIEASRKRTNQLEVMHLHVCYYHCRAPPPVISRLKWVSVKKATKSYCFLTPPILIPKSKIQCF